MIRILVFEDSPKFLAALRLILNDADGIQITADYPDANDGCTKVREHLPDLILMDIEMPGIDGIQATEQIKAEFPDIPIVMLTVLNDGPQITAAIQAGANGYLVKSWSGQQYIQKIQEVCAGLGPVFTPEIGQVLFDIIREQSVVKFPPRHFKLSKRENEVLCELVKGKTYLEIAGALYISESTVNTHLKNIFKKFKVHSQVEAVRIAHQYHLCKPENRS